MGTKYYLHVGLNRTGTSAIQEGLFSNAAYLESIGIKYPSSPLSSDGLPHHFLGNSESDLFKKYISDIVMDSDGIYENVILSSETLSWVSLNHLENIIKCFPSKPIIIIYVRNVFDFLRSWYNYSVSYSNSFINFPEFCQRISVNKKNQLNAVSTVLTAAKNNEIEVVLKQYKKNDATLINFLKTIDSLNVDVSKIKTGDFLHNQSLSGVLFNLRLLSNFSLSNDDVEKSISDVEKISWLSSSFRGVSSISYNEASYVYDNFIVDEVSQLNNMTNFDLGGLSADLSDISQPIYSESYRNDIDLIYNYIKEQGLNSPFSNYIISNFK